MSKLPVAIFLALILNLAAAAQRVYPEIREVLKLKPLVSNRADVERVARSFGTKLSENSVTLRGTDFIFSFASGDCAKDDWSVPKGFLQDFEIFFAERRRAWPRPSEVGIRTERLISLNSDEKPSPKEFVTADGQFIDISTGVAVELENGFVRRIRVLPAESKAAMLCPNVSSARPTTYKAWLDGQTIFQIYDYKGVADVTRMRLSTSELCFGAEQTSINIETLATGEIGDVFTFSYKISAGVIVGKGAKVTWDLTGVAPGNYTITAGADNGCGVCGTTKTETVTVKNCG